MTEIDHKYLQDSVLSAISPLNGEGPVIVSPGCARRYFFILDYIDRPDSTMGAVARVFRKNIAEGVCIAMDGKLILNLRAR